MNPRNRVFLLLGLLFVGSLIWYLTHDYSSKDLKLIGTVDANEILVGSRIQGRIATLAVVEGQPVKDGQLLATIEADDLSDATRAALASAESQQGKLASSVATLTQTEGEVSSAELNARATLAAAQAAEAQAMANLDHQQADTDRIVALTQQGIDSQQQHDDAVTALAASRAALDAARQQTAAAAAALNQARAHTLLASAQRETVASTRHDVANARALADQAKVQFDYSRVYAPATGTVNVLAARQGEVVSPGEAIVTIMDLSQTWIYAPLPETQSDAVHLGDSLRVDLPSGAHVQGKVIAKTSLADFATQRDINGGRKRDIRTVQIKLAIPNQQERFSPGMTAVVIVPRDRLVKQ